MRERIGRMAATLWGRSGHRREWPARGEVGQVATRVLATEEARQAITQIQTILNNGLAQTIGQLKSQGTNLSEPNVWDGQLAMEFRSSIWPQCSAALDSAQTQLQELHQKLQQIHQNIMAAGGNL
jgi:hypothetical protein